MKSNRFFKLTAAVLLLLLSTFASFAQGQGQMSQQQRELADYIKSHYTKREVMIPMRDGVKLFVGIYEPKDETTVTRQLYFHWDYINEQMKKRFPKRAEFAGVFIVQIADGSRAAEVSQAIDRLDNALPAGQAFVERARHRLRTC